MIGMFCPKCGKENPDTNQFCGVCGENLIKTPPIQKETLTPKEKRAIRAQIEIKNTEYEQYRGWGPTILIILGILTIWALIGLIFISIGVWWLISRRKKRAVILAEIDALEEELGEEV